jgi:insulysin
MSFKDGIPLLTTLDDDEDVSDEDFTVELASASRHKWGRKHLLFGLGLGLVVFVVVALIVAVAVPIALLQGGGGGSKAGGGSTDASETSSISPSVTVSPTPSPSPNDINSYKPTSDNRQYDFLVLSNSLRVVLVSDPKSNVSAASVEVAAGSFSDPLDAEGLAHFCEHMLFLGTEKYPNEHEYSNYLTAHGGGDNAFTSTQDTNYYFTVDSKYLEKSLDLFAQFFISPLFKNSSVADEVHAVNAEHEKNLLSDPWKLWQLLKHVSNPLHPFHQFATGTLSTLNNSNLLDLLKTYYSSSYSANTMQLVVYGKDPLPTLTSWVNTSFSSIPNRHISPQTFATTPFPQEYSQKLVFYYPVADTNSLSLYWQTAPLDPHYRNDVVEFLSRYLGYEGEGSVLQYLKSESLAVSLSAGLEVSADSFSLFLVSIELTEKGLGRVPDIVKTVFQFISLLSSQSESQMKSLWDSHVAVSRVVFDHSEPEEPSDYTTHISQRMRLVEEAPDFLGNPRRFVFNYSLVESVLDTLTPEKLILFLGTHHLNFSSSGLGPPDDNPPPEQNSSPVDFPWPELDQKEPIYSTPFSSIDTPPELLEYWGSLTPAPQDLSLPGRNYFIPTDFGLLQPPSNPSDTPSTVSVGSNGVSLWFLQDTTFETPHINMYCSITAANPDSDSVRWSELTVLYAQMVVEALTPVLYPAAELTYSMGLSATPQGLQLTFSGFSDPNIMTTYIGITVQS